MVDYVPKRGHFILLSFDPQAGHEQMGTRPALVLSHDAFNRTMGFVFVCPISTTQRKNPFYIAIPGKLSVSGVIMVDQLRSLDYRARKAKWIGDCPEELLNEILRRVKPILF